MIRLTYPFTEAQVRALKVGDAVSIDGLIHTGRDKFHKYFAEGHPLAVDFEDGALYHCGPVVIGEPGAYRVMAAGPTTSVRENPYEPAFIAQSGVRIIIGKGGMDNHTLAAMQQYGCVYIQAVGGAAALAGAAVREVKGVDYLDEFGAAEACWHFEMRGFTGIVAMDAHGNSLFAQIEAASAKRLRDIL